ncbi:zinc finger (Ran-binding) family protein [Forsythia ovata]|uniref:Zinc finger (Ran-binding) family protein n=1 Tax=Forsythia ovata TaxID=205694 RepID=A0ABD1U5V3_9LAMI
MGGGEAVGGGGGGGGGREGDWECSGCRNRNYAFRSFCNRCKQPRLLVDYKTPADSKWLPRIGDWICTGCTNNNYASREKCKKCGQPKEVAAMPALAIPGASVPTHANYFASAQGGLDQNVNVGSLQQSLALSSSWSIGGLDKYGGEPTNIYGLQTASTWPLIGNNISGVPFASQTNQLSMVPNGWRSGDWICPCGFHNYSSRVQCKKCNAPMPQGEPSSLINTAVTAIGTKRLASEEFAHNWDNKRLNAGQTYGLQQSVPGFDLVLGSGSNNPNSMYPAIPSASSAIPPASHVILQVPRVPAAPTLLGKGAKQWREGDWMCTNCNNHNYASRAQCNRCKTQREVLPQSVSVV